MSSKVRLEMKCSDSERDGLEDFGKSVARDVVVEHPFASAYGLPMCLEVLYNV